MMHFLEDRLVCIVENSKRIVVSPMENFLLWSRIIQIIIAFVFMVMSSQVTREKALMELMTFKRDQNSGLVSENSVKLRFSYRLSSSINPSAVSGISGVIIIFNFFMSWRVIYDDQVRASSSSLIYAT